MAVYACNLLIIVNILIILFDSYCVTFKIIYRSRNRRFCASAFVYEFPIRQFLTLISDTSQRAGTTKSRKDLKPFYDIFI